MGVKRVVKGTRPTAIAARVVNERVTSMRRRMRSASMGATHRAFSLEESLDYIRSVHGDYVRYAELGPDELNGARVLELGPGDNLGVALLFLADGAERVVGVDRFHTWRDPDQQQRICAALIEGLDEGRRDRLGSLLNADGHLDVDSDRLPVMEGLAIEEAAQVLPPESFDVIVSRAVLEHVLDLDAAFAAMDRLLRPGGVMAHKVDLSDHGIFTDGGLHPLMFMTVGDRTYRAMGANGGLPNRVPASYYPAEVRSLGYEATMLLTHTIDTPAELDPHPATLDPGTVARLERQVDEIRPRLRSELRDLPATTLGVSGIFLIARKPG